MPLHHLPYYHQPLEMANFECNTPQISQTHTSTHRWTYTDRQNYMVAYFSITHLFEKLYWCCCHAHYLLHGCHYVLLAACYPVTAVALLNGHAWMLTEFITSAAFYIFDCYILFLLVLYSIMRCDSFESLMCFCTSTTSAICESNVLCFTNNAGLVGHPCTKLLSRKESLSLTTLDCRSVICGRAADFSGLSLNWRLVKDTVIE